MQINEIINSTNYIDTVNKLDNLINELLYSQETGYINLASQNAIQSTQEIIDKFNNESDIIIKESLISNSSELIKQKKNELIKAMHVHYEKQVIIWANEVFNKNIDNLLLKLGANKNNVDDIEKIYSQLHFLINWISEVENFSKEEKSVILKEVDLKVQNALNSPDENYILKENPTISDENLFMEFFNLISSNTGQFLNIDFNNYKSRLSNKDVIYFQNLQNRLKINKTAVIDETDLQNYALKILELKTDSEKYKFIKEIIDDFSLIKDSSTDNKISAIKRRVKLFKNKEDYYRKLFG